MVKTIERKRIKQRTINNIDYYVYRFKKNGNSKTIYAKTIKQLNEKYNEYLSTIGDKTPHKKQPNFNTLFEDYLRSKKIDWKIQTYVSRLNFYEKHLKKSILSKMKIEEISKQSILSFIQKLDLSFSTKKEKLNQLKQFFNYCIEEDYISKNVCRNIKIKSIALEEEECSLSPQTVKAILDDCRGLEIESAIILLCNGCRLGESLGANINNIKGNYILINESLTKVSLEGKTTHILENPKNAHSIRKLYLSEEHISILLNCKTDSRGYFSNIEGNKWVSRKRIYDYLSKYNCKPHMLRKFYCSFLLMNGANIYIVKSQLGHSKSSTLTESVYLQTTSYVEREMRQFF